MEVEVDIKELQDRQVGLGMNNKQFAAFLGIHEKSWSRIKRHGVVTPRFEKKLAGMFWPIPSDGIMNPYWTGTGGWSDTANHWATKKPSLIDRIKGWFRW